MELEKIISMATERLAVDGSPYRDLMAGVLRQALHDYLKKIPPRCPEEEEKKYKSKTRNDRYYKEQSKRWIYGNFSARVTFGECCQALDLSPERVRRLIHRMRNRSEKWLKLRMRSAYQDGSGVRIAESQ